MSLPYQAKDEPHLEAPWHAPAGQGFVLQRCSPAASFAVRGRAFGDKPGTARVAQANGIPGHAFAGAPRPQRWRVHLPTEPAVADGGPTPFTSAALEGAGDVVGFALNGIPFFGTPLVQGADADDAAVAGAADCCGGRVEDRTGRYHYPAGAVP